MVKTITLPLPNKILSPNARPNRYAKSACTKSHRTNSKRETYKAMQSWGLPMGTFYVTHLSLVAYWPSKKHQWDDINLLASCKAYEDGIVDAVQIDDSNWRMGMPEHHVDTDNPRLEIQIHIESLI